MLAAKSPAEHRFISKVERDYVMSRTHDDMSVKKDPFLTTIKNLLTTRSFYAIVIANSTSNFGSFLFLTQLPTYMKEVLHFDIKSVIAKACQYSAVSGALN